MKKLKEYGQIFNEDLKNYNHKHGATVTQSKNDNEKNYYFRKQIIEIAKKHDYFADTKHYKSWSRLVIHTDSTFEIIFSIHGLGHSDNGMMAISGFTFEKNISEDRITDAINIRSAQQDIFSFNYLDSCL